MPTAEIKKTRHVAKRRLPVGAELTADGVHFAVWAPKLKTVDVALDNGGATAVIALTRAEDGYFSGYVPEARVGSRYRFRIDGGESFPDPASRFQPKGPHDSSQVIDPFAFAWTDEKWLGVAAQGQVLYELHLGTFTHEGTWASAAQQLPALKALGVTTLEIMPINEFSGRFGWGYDGVSLFAPFHGYGTPDDARRFVNEAHALGLAVILDVVYNHLGPDGNYLTKYSDQYFSSGHTDWGNGLNFDGEASQPVRDFFLANARHWIEEYHFDGFRFDATQAIADNSARHILADICETARAVARPRQIFLVNENEPQHTRLVRPVADGGYGMDALWNDDFHHSAMVALSGHNEAYYTDYAGTPQELLAAAKWGYLYQGQRYAWQEQRRGTPGLDLPPTAFVNFLQNHDQVANSGAGLRAHELASPAELRAMTTLLLTMPQTPMLFQGQEFAASSRFQYFADHGPELAEKVRRGRRRELSQFASIATPAMQALLTDPADMATFTRCKLDHAERERPRHAEMLRLHTELLTLRRTDPIFSRVMRRGDYDGAVLSANAFLLRFFAHGDAAGDRLVLVNLGNDLHLVPSPEPLLAPPSEQRWRVIFSSEDPHYGGCGTPHVDTESEGWLLGGRTAVVLAPAATKDASVETRVKFSGSVRRVKDADDDER